MLSLLVSVSSRAVAFWPVRTAFQRVVRNSVRLRATLWDGFVGSNVGFLLRPGDLVWPPAQALLAAIPSVKYYSL